MGSIPQCAANLGRRKKQARVCARALCPSPSSACLPEPPKEQHPQRTALGGPTGEEGPTTPEGARGSSSLLGVWGSCSDLLAGKSQLSPGKVPASSSSFGTGSPER